MGIRRIYRKKGQRLANYDFFDLATGRGVKQLYMGDFKNGSTFVMNENTWYAHDGHINNGNGSAIDVDFDMNFYKPISIGGYATINLPVIYRNNAVSSQTFDKTWTVYIRKWDGATETEIASDTYTENNAVNIASGTGAFRMLALRPNIPKTNFKRGESLRITITVPSNTATIEVYLFCDPQNRSTTQLGLSLSETPTLSNSQLKINMPFVIDL